MPQENRQRGRGHSREVKGQLEASQVIILHSVFLHCYTDSPPSASTQALEAAVSDHLKAPSVMRDKLKNKQREVQNALKTLEREVKLR